MELLEHWPLFGIAVAMVLFLAKASKMVPEAWRFVKACAGVPFALEAVAKALAAIEELGAKVDANHLAATERFDGLYDRLDKVEHELHPNSSASMRDAIDRTEVGLGELRHLVDTFITTQVDPPRRRAAHSPRRNPS